MSVATLLPLLPDGRPLAGMEFHFLIRSTTDWPRIFAWIFRQKNIATFFHRSRCHLTRASRSSECLCFEDFPYFSFSPPTQHIMRLLASSSTRKLASRSMWSRGGGSLLRSPALPTVKRCHGELYSVSCSAASAHSQVDCLSLPVNSALSKQVMLLAGK